MAERGFRRARVAVLCLLAVAAGLPPRAGATECATAITPRPVPLPVPDEVLQSRPSLDLELGSFNIDIVPGATLQANPPALAAFQRAADQWKAYIADPIGVTINADLANLGSSSIIGQSSAVLLIASYGTMRNAVVADGALDAGDAIAAALPTSMGFLYPPGFGPTGNLVATKANLKALGFAGLDTMFGASDASITFNTQFNFDYDNTDGVTPGMVDFESVAAHEIGHALGFISSVDDVDASPAPTTISATPLDLYRFEYNTPQTPATVADFTAFPRSQEPGVEAVFDDLASQDRMSTGKVHGDGRQASHWKDDALTGVYIGIMDPTLSAGVVETVGPADVRALDLIGWDVGAVGSTTTTTSTTSTTTTTVPILCAPTPASGCRQAGASALTIRATGDPARDQLKWAWSRGGGTSVAAFQNPVNGASNYEVCVYDASGHVQPLSASRVLPGGTCGGRPCWKPAGLAGFAYANRLGTPQGIVAMKLRAGLGSRAQVKVAGKGANLPTPAPPLTLPVTVQLLISDGTSAECWQSDFAAAPANGAGKFKAKTP
jgi:hypothetical protein